MRATSAGSSTSAGCQLLQDRVDRHARIEAGDDPTFPAETQEIRDADWKVAPTPADLNCRWAEITGPVDRKMMINALNSGAKVFMADLEDALSPSWRNVIEGQQNLYDAVRKQLEFTNPGERQGVPVGGRDRDLAGPPARLAPDREERTDRRQAPSRPASSISASTSSTTRRRLSAAAAGPTSTCRSWRTGTRRGSGTTSSSPPRTHSACPRAASGPRC